MRAKKHYTHYEDAQLRFSQIAAIDPQLDFGNGLTVSSYGTAITDFRSNLDNYNTSVAALDAQLTALQAQERLLKDQSDRMLAGVGVYFGKNSPEYERAGGVRKDKRRKPKKALA